MARGVFLVDKNPDIEWDIKCELHPDYAKEEMPEDQQKLYVEIESVNNVIKELKYTDKSRKEDYSKKLLLLAQAGLVGETAQPGLAKMALVKLKDEIIICEGEKIKNKYMISLGQSALLMGIIALILGLVIYKWCCNNIAAYLFVWVGAMAGTWISFGVRKINLKFEDLSVIEEDRLLPNIRLVFMGITAIFVLLFLKSGIITITIGTLSSSVIDGNIEFQILLGAIAGLLEHKVAINIFNRASSLF